MEVQLLRVLDQRGRDASSSPHLAMTLGLPHSLPQGGFAHKQRWGNYGVFGGKVVPINRKQTNQVTCLPLSLVMVWNQIAELGKNLTKILFLA